MCRARWAGLPSLQTAGNLNKPYAALCRCRTWQVLGTPSREEIHAMNPNYTEFKFPQVERGP